MIFTVMIPFVRVELLDNARRKDLIASPDDKI